jgi:NDP-4-keto-2,6-dideoxyhexose 3-C-methyltransferase
MFKEINCCRVCHSSNIKPILSLGELAVSDFVDNPSKINGIVAPLELVLCNKNEGGCGLLQLKHTVSDEAMFRNYWYLSGINQTMTEELSQITKSVSKIVTLDANDYVIDIGSNDGTLLRSYQAVELNTVGFEPARNLQKYGSKGTTSIIVDFFSSDAWVSVFGDKKAKVITAIGMFYDLDDPNSFIKDVYKCLDDDGLLVIQMMYVPFFLERNAFDGICHEHLEYYTMNSLSYLLEMHGFEIFDVKLREEINEGSVRFYIRKRGKGQTLNFSDGAQDSLLKLIDLEKKLKLNELNTYHALVDRILDAKQKTISFLNEEVKNGKVIHGYAASTKGNTTLQFYEITPNQITAIADRNPNKFGLYTVGTGIPVISEEESRQMKPDYYFVLAWHFLPEFVKREKSFLESGGKFIVSMPDFKIIGDDF